RGRIDGQLKDDQGTISGSVSGSNSVGTLCVGASEDEVLVEEEIQPGGGTIDQDFPGTMRTLVHVAHPTVPAPPLATPRIGSPALIGSPAQ
ncbi:MAG TPA: hypothetical protein VGA13_06020, partial [Acidimicrobiales bacterium]